MDIGGILSVIIWAIINTPFWIFTMVIIVVMLWVYKLGSFNTTIKNLDGFYDKTNGKCENLSMDISTIKWTLQVIHTQISTLSQDVRIATASAGSGALTRTNSPMQLTDKWRELVDNTNVKETLQAKLPDIFAAYPQLSASTNPFDIQQASIEIADDIFEKFLSKEQQEDLKGKVFVVWGNLIDLRNLIWVILRDIVFESKGISIESLIEENQ